MKLTFNSTVVAALAFIMLGGAASAQAASQLDNGNVVKTDNPYQNAQTIHKVFENEAVYGKLTETPPVDVYTFVPEKDGEQTISLLSKVNKDTQTVSQAVAILVDPTDKTTGEDLGLPVPPGTTNYHTKLLAVGTGATTYKEKVLGQEYNVLAQEKVSLQKDATYYIIVLDPYQVTTTYAIKFGEGSAWKASDVITHFPTWFKLQTNNYGGSSPFVFNKGMIGLLILLVGLMVLIGVFTVQETFSFLANKSRSAGYVLVQMQPFTRILIWLSLWFLAIGAYMYFSQIGWVGLPTVITAIFVVVLVSMLYQTLRLSPRISKLRPENEGILIPFTLRKRWFFSFLVSLFGLVAITVFLVILLTPVVNG